MKRVTGFARICPMIKVLALIIATRIIATGDLPEITHTSITIITALVSLTSLTIINDYFDIKEDKTRKLKRPLAQDQITEESAIALATLLFSISLALSHYFLTPICTFILIINTIIITIYSHYKEKSPMCAIYRGYFNGSIILFGSFSTNPQNTAIIKLTVILALLIALTSAARKIMHSIDGQNGIKYKRITLATYYGDKTAAIISASLIIATIFLSIIPAATLGQNYLYMISIADIILTYAGLRILINTKYAMESQRFIKISMIIIMISFVVAALP
ncbi:MAG: UbiA family prenyltransferase [Candidatus Aenigmarchaeota archaeon]|nr:UbiA family prenyltransferase [Candidatus Aenigmarchaeota archaeon]